MSTCSCTLPIKACDACPVALSETPAPNHLADGCTQGNYQREHKWQYDYDLDAKVCEVCGIVRYYRRGQA